MKLFIQKTHLQFVKQPGKVVERATETRCETDRLARERQACSNAKASLPSESTWAERAARWNPVRSQRVRDLRINGRNSYMNPRQRKRRRCWYVTIPIWKSAGETDGNKKTPLHFWSEVFEVINTIWQRPQKTGSELQLIANHPVFQFEESFPFSLCRMLVQIFDVYRQTGFRCVQRITDIFVSANGHPHVGRINDQAQLMSGLDSVKHRL